MPKKGSYIAAGIVVFFMVAVVVYFLYQGLSGGNVSIPSTLSGR
jgi:hypothetical protein